LEYYFIYNNVVALNLGMRYENHFLELGLHKGYAHRIRIMHMRK